MNDCKENILRSSTT